jgi:hypothetical protein
VTNSAIRTKDRTMHVRRIALTIAVTMQLSGCVAWRRQEVAPKKLILETNPEVVQVIRRDSSKTLVYQPKIISDSLLTGHPSALAIERLVIPLNDITAVATRYKHMGKTLIAGLAVLGGVAVYALLQSLNSTSF